QLRILCCRTPPLSASDPRQFGPSPSLPLLACSWVQTCRHLLHDFALKAKRAMIHVVISILLGLTTVAVVVAHQLAEPTTFYYDFAVFWDMTVLALKHPELTYDPPSICFYPPTALVVFSPFAFLPFP